jgi:hypothetical protein
LSSSVYWDATANDDGSDLGASSSVHKLLLSGISIGVAFDGSVIALYLEKTYAYIKIYWHKERYRNFFWNRLGLFLHRITAKKQHTIS